MILPTDFTFSQSSLQDYVDCPRRFYLKHVQRQSWPALEAEPVLEHEVFLREGAEFHRLLHRHALGMPESQLSSLAASAQLDASSELEVWWNNYLQQGPSDLPEQRYPEVELSTLVSEHALLAKYDLVALDPGQRVVIVDWKTSRNRTRRRTLAERLQTRVYRFLMVQAGRDLGLDEDVRPEQVEMVYWFANYPDKPQHFSYDEEQHQSDADYVSSLIDEIAKAHSSDFFLTPNDQHCRYCRYRSLCGRGVEAGLLAEDDDWDGEEDPLMYLDLEQIAEIEY